MDSSAVHPAEEYSARVRVALALRDIRDYRAALEQLKKATEVAPSEIEARLLLGLTYGDLQQHRAAEKALRRAVDLDPDSAEARIALGTFLIEHEKFPAAARCLRPLAEQGDDVMAERAYARALSNTPGGLKQAAAVLETALRREPDDAELAHELADYYVKLGDDAAVVRVLAPLAGRHPNVALPLAEAHRRLGQFADAAACAESAANALPDAPWIWAYLSTLALAAGENEKALAVATRAIELAPDSGFAWASLALALVRAKRWSEADRALEKALRLGREQGLPAEQLAWLQHLREVSECHQGPQPESCEN